VNESVENHPVFIRLAEDHEKLKDELMCNESIMREQLSKPSKTNVSHEIEVDDSLNMEISLTTQQTKDTELKPMDWFEFSQGEKKANY
jgi:hypothetical protein